jgi:hypothetical protein
LLNYLPHPQHPPATNSSLAAELNTLSIQLIRKLASAKKVRVSGTRAQIAANLAGLITEVDTASATPSAAAADIAALV